jgi:hypothetical protein
MNFRTLLIACIAACFCFARACAGDATATSLSQVFDINGDGTVSDAEISATVSRLAPGKSEAQHQAIVEVAPTLMLDASLLERPNHNAKVVFLLDENSISVGTCLQRTDGHAAECSDPNKDGLIVRDEFRYNQYAISVVRRYSKRFPNFSETHTPPNEVGEGKLFAAEHSAAVSNLEPEETAVLPQATEVVETPDRRPSNDMMAAECNVTSKVGLTDGVQTPTATPLPPSPPRQHHEHTLQLVNTSASVSNNFWNWRISSVENTRLCDSWIVPLTNDPRSLLIWLRYFDHSSFLDRIDHHVDQLNVVEFAFKCAFVPSYPLLRMVQEEISAFSYSSPSGIRHLAVFFLFLRVLCEGFSSITLLLWFTGTYKTPRFGAIWSRSIAKHMLGTASAAVIFYYSVWNVMPSFIITTISYIFIYFIWPLGSLLLVYSLIIDGLKPATAAVIKAASPRAKASRPPAPPSSESASHADTFAGVDQQQRPKRRGSGVRAMSPVTLH